VSIRNLTGVFPERVRPLSAKLSDLVFELYALDAVMHPAPWLADCDLYEGDEQWTGKFYCGTDEQDIGARATWCTYNDEPPGAGTMTAQAVARLRTLLPTIREQLEKAQIAENERDELLVQLREQKAEMAKLRAETWARARVLRNACNQWEHFLLLASRDVQTPPLPAFAELRAARDSIAFSDSLSELLQAEEAVVAAAVEAHAAEDAWSRSQGEHEEQQAAYTRHCTAQDALHDATVTLNKARAARRST